MVPHSKRVKESCKDFWGLALGATQYHFLYILLVKGKTQGQPDSKGREIDSSPLWEEQERHIARGQSKRMERITEAIFTKKSTTVSFYPLPTTIPIHITSFTRFSLLQKAAAEKEWKSGKQRKKKSLSKVFMF